MQLRQLRLPAFWRSAGSPSRPEAIVRGIESVRWPGRLERLQARPDVYLDGTHNPAGARELLAFWHEHLAGRRIHLIYGAMRDKAIDEVAGLLFPQGDDRDLNPVAAAAFALRGGVVSDDLAPCRFRGTGSRAGRGAGTRNRNRPTRRRGLRYRLALSGGGFAQTLERPIGAGLPGAGAEPDRRL